MAAIVQAANLCPIPKTIRRIKGDKILIMIFFRAVLPPPKFNTNFLYTNRETKSKYVWLKYQSILKNRVLDVEQMNVTLNNI